MYTIFKIFSPPNTKGSNSIPISELARYSKLFQSTWHPDPPLNAAATFRKWWKNTEASPKWKNTTKTSKDRLPIEDPSRHSDLSGSRIMSRSPKLIPKSGSLRNSPFKQSQRFTPADANKETQKLNTISCQIKSCHFLFGAKQLWCNKLWVETIFFGYPLKLTCSLKHMLIINLENDYRLLLFFFQPIRSNNIIRMNRYAKIHLPSHNWKFSYYLFSINYFD